MIWPALTIVFTVLAFGLLWWENHMIRKSRDIWHDLYHREKRRADGAINVAKIIIGQIKIKEEQ